MGQKVCPAYLAFWLPLVNTNVLVVQLPNTGLKMVSSHESIQIANANPDTREHSFCFFQLCCHLLPFFFRDRLSTFQSCPQSTRCSQEQINLRRKLHIGRGHCCCGGFRNAHHRNLRCRRCWCWNCRLRNCSTHAGEHGWSNAMRQALDHRTASL